MVWRTLGQLQAQARFKVADLREREAPDLLGYGRARRLAVVDYPPVELRRSGAPPDAAAIVCGSTFIPNPSASRVR